MSDERKPRRFTLYIDESGDHRYLRLDDLRARYLALCGVVVESAYYRSTFVPEFNLLRQTHFDSHPDEPVILHREDILNARGAFRCLQTESVRAAFNADLLSLFGRMNYRVITVVLDKASYFRRKGEGWAKPAYHYCLQAVMERYCGLLKYRGAVGDVYAEARGKREDRELKDAFTDLLYCGTEFHEARFFSNVLTSKEMKLKPKTADIIGLQFSDLLAHPSRCDVINEYGAPCPADGPFGESVRNAIARKYNSRAANSQVRGYGKILLK